MMIAAGWTLSAMPGKRHKTVQGSEQNRIEVVSFLRIREFCRALAKIVVAGTQPIVCKQMSQHNRSIG
jgi:hypothetical protein